MLGLYAVADAMGGAGTGRPAADLAIATLQQGHATHDPGRDGLAATVMAANAAIRERADAATRYWQDRQPGPRVDMNWIGAGTTIVALRISEGAGTIVHVGDSRAYRWRDGFFKKLTIDHRLCEDARRFSDLSEEQIAEIPPRIITRGLGFREHVEIEIDIIDTKPGDLFLLASDGLTDALTDLTIAARIGDHRDYLGHRGDLNILARLLVEQAAATTPSSITDNITVVLIAVDGDSD